MKLKKFALFVSIALIFCVCLQLNGYTFNKKNINTTASYSQVKDNLWCVTFQLVWNEMTEKLGLDKITFAGGNPSVADELNKKLYTKNILSENSYYIKSGKISHKLKNQIEKDIYNKFKEKSDIIDFINWNAQNSYLFYSMLKKDFNFLTEFDRYDSDKFNSKGEKVKYFGIKNSSDKKLKDNVQVLFYNSTDEYAVKLNTKENEDVILFRTDKNDNFENLYSYIETNSDFMPFNDKDVLKIPDIDVDKTIKYEELIGKRIENTEYIISDALQTIKFKMDNKGGSLKSEAAIAIMKTSLLPRSKYPRYFFFDKRFVLFLKEQDKDKPYYAMVVDDNSFLVKD